MFEADSVPPNLHACRGEDLRRWRARFFSFFFFFKYLFIYLAALGLSCRTRDLHCGMWDL